MPGKILYKAEPVSNVSNLQELFTYIKRELEAIERSFSITLANPLEELNVAPTKVFTGLTVLADGTNWNPGAGQGVYTYYAGSWHKLG